MISKINFSRPISFRVAYEGEGDGTSGAGDSGAGGGAAGGAGTGAGKTFTQADIDRIVQERLAKQTKTHNADKQKLIDQLTTLQEQSGTSEAQKAQLETQIEELRNSMLSRDELERKNKEKLEKDWQTKHEAAVSEAKTWQSKHNSLFIGHEINRACAEHDVLPNSVVFVESLLAPKARLVELTGDDGKPNGRYEAKVKIQSADKAGKPVELDVTVGEAIKIFKDEPTKYGNLFKGNNAGGLGGGTGSPGKPVNVKSMDMAEYMRRRKDDPASVGLA